jgi:hypothetical protein
MMVEPDYLFMFGDVEYEKRTPSYIEALDDYLREDDKPSC